MKDRVNESVSARYRSVFRPGLFDGKVVMVTGAGSGLGRCTAHELTSLGATLIMVGRNPDKLTAVRDELNVDYPESADRIGLYSCDIRDEASVKQTVAAALADFGRIDGLFNCAGGQFPAQLEKISLNGWDAVVRNNLHGTFLMSRECFTQWMAGHGGAIVNMLADIWGGMPGMGHSGAARAGVWNLTETAACEWGHAGVRVNAVAPGWIASAGMDSYNEEYQALLRQLKHKVPLQRFGTESELASAAVFLLSEASAFINGTVIRVDGGVPNARHSWPLSNAERITEYNGFPRYEPPKGLQD
ncbi:SDR family oxidoreductase [Paraburkholderia hospita]|jgi:citronellol/citronellal dehydrogenase|uniref:SDR family oxidoreductase n=1 Tax=Paraburkholderia hospita TaxID=169430 RepID=UPI003ED134A7